MIGKNTILSASVLAVLAVGLPTASAAPRKGAEANLSGAARQLETKYASTLKSLQAEIARALPRVDARKLSVLEKAREAADAAQKEADATRQALGKIGSAQGLVEHAKKKWIGGAEKGIAQAEAALKKASTAAEREAAQNELVKWQANKAEGIKALEERQSLLDKAKSDEAKLTQANQAAQETLAKENAIHLEATQALLAEMEPFLSSDKLDAKLATATVLAAATPRGLAEFAQQGGEELALVDKLLSDDGLMKEMLIAGGAARNNYGRAMEIYAQIQQASPKAREGLFQRLALATGLEHAEPVAQSNAADVTGAPAVVDPVKRYLHYEKAYLDGELDPVFKNFSTWEYRMVVGCDAPDEILAWGREMLRTYRPDHVSDPNYGWRYSSAVKTEVKYGSQNVSKDLPSLNKYQNIPMNGGVCGRRAFFGRFILRSFGIPTWGVTQHKHAALSHWTPKGWVVNLGAGFNASWWDKDGTPRSGSDFLLEAQAREHAQAYLKVLRAQWTSQVLGEQAYNDRRNITGGFWSRVGHYQTVALAAHAVELGPLGQELGEANEPEEKQTARQAPVKAADQQIVTGPDGTITIPAVAHASSTGKTAAMASVSGGMQMFSSGGFKTQYEFKAPQAGKYLLTARVATLAPEQMFLLTTKSSGQSVEVEAPFTIGTWQQSQPVEISLVKGKNVLHFEIPEGSRGMTLKDFTLKPEQ